MNNTGSRIRDARIKAGLTQAELGDSIGVGFSAIHKYENGLVVNLKRDTIAALADALDVSPAYLMCLDNQDDISPARKKLLDAVENMSEEEIKKLLRVIEAVKGLDI